ncbi:E3 ubiquitin-protein ligase mib1 [Biomphalaria glabrata]|nr:E3 ubiquitin-protein ligase mib1 [Biomphalaria glabrata]
MFLYCKPITGVKHDGVMCDLCKVCPIKGIRWKCALCFNFDLCSACYHGNKHDSTHSFWRYDNAQNKRFQIPWRDKETFRDPIYVPGKQSEEGGAEEVTLACGTVLTIKPWDDDTSNSAATVKWDNGITNTYRLGWHGKVDLKFKTAASGGHFYISHLPMLGKMEVTPCQFELGDAVTCRYDTRQVTVLQVNHGGWNPQMSQYLQQNGKVLEIDGDSDVLVEYFDGAAWRFNPDALCRSKDLKNFTRSPMDSNAVSTVLELGLDEDLVQKVVWRDFFNSKTCFTDTELLLNTILDEPNTQNTHLATDTLNVGTDTDSDDDSYTSSGNDRDSTTFSELERETNPTPNLTSSTLVAAKESAATVENDQTLAEKYRQLMEERQCKICMEAEARMTFVPCGHLVSCEDCSSQLKQCPMCRSDIEKVVKTFLL